MEVNGGFLASGEKMTVELLTGTPGAGKTTYAVAVRIASEVDSKLIVEQAEQYELEWFWDAHPDRWEQLSSGARAIKRRIVVSGIRGLVLEHERLPHQLTGDAPAEAVVSKWNAMCMSPDHNGRSVETDLPQYQRRYSEAPNNEAPCLVQTWWLWCWPGDIIVCDEVQFLAPRGMLGRKPPWWVGALTIHRHYAIDFLFISQTPSLIDSNIKQVVGLHRHVRSVLGSPLCTVYTWDHASNTERITNAAKSAFLRRRKHYALFKSAVAHVKPPKAGRGAVMLVPVLACVVVAGFMHMRSKFAPQDAAVATSTKAASSASTSATIRQLPPRRNALAGWVDAPVVRGCYAVADICRCIGDAGRPVEIAPQMCKTTAAGFDGLLQWERSTSKRYAEPAKGNPLVEDVSAPSAAASSPPSSRIALLANQQ